MQHHQLTRIIWQNQDLDLDEYLITVDDSHKQHYNSCSNVILHDDHSLQVALKTMSERHYLELVLQHKRAHTLSPPASYFRRNTSPPGKQLLYNNLMCYTMHVYSLPTYDTCSCCTIGSSATHQADCN